MKGQLNELFKRHPGPWSYRRSLNDGASVVDAKGKTILRHEDDALLRLVAASRMMLSVCSIASEMRGLTFSAIEDLAHDASAVVNHVAGES